MKREAPNSLAEIEKLRRQLRSNGQIRHIIDGLSKAGCREEAIIRSLFFYCGADPGIANTEKAEIRRHRKHIIDLSRHLEAVATEIEVVEEYLKDVRIVCYFTPDSTGLRNYAHLLSKIAKTAYRRFASKRNTGRDHHLIYLYRTIEKSTGRPQYSELADLINATRLVYQPNPKIMDAKSVQELIKRHKQDYDLSDFEE